MKILVAFCVLVAGVSAQVGHSGIINPNGVNQQFSQAFADDIVLIGPSGILTKSGNNLQLTSEQAALHNRRKRSASESNPKVYGDSGIVSGYQNIQLFPGEYVVVSSDSGAVLNTGRNVQYREKRGAELLKGSSGVLFNDGQSRHLPPGVTKVLETESGIVYSDGKNIQF